MKVVTATVPVFVSLLALKNIKLSLTACGISLADDKVAFLCDMILNDINYVIYQYPASSATMENFEVHDGTLHSPIPNPM